MSGLLGFTYYNNVTRFTKSYKVLELVENPDHQRLKRKKWWKTKLTQWP